ncbi:GPI mannosyltransferase [Pelomyxa schiedti]|nr:GPI mannosyltransferase [Pelomyxa schiedti]
MNKELTPPYKWADDRCAVSITVPVAGIDPATARLSVQDEGRVLQLRMTQSVTSKGTTSVNKFKLNLTLFAPIRQEDCVVDVNPRRVVLKLPKLEPGVKWKQLQKAGIPKPPSESIDWDRVQLDDEDDNTDVIDISPLDNATPDTFVSRIFAKPTMVWRKFSTALNLQIDQWDITFYYLVFLSLLLCPYTKVEESFNVQAMHDIMYHGWNLDKYDHFEFPGVVPRTFIGAVAIAIPSLPLSLILRVLYFPKVLSLYLVRFILGCTVATCFGSFRKEVASRFGYEAGCFMTFITFTQFHILFYSTRPLPNTFAFALVVVSFTLLSRGGYLKAVAVLAFTCIVFRCDVAVLAAPIVLEILVRRLVPIRKLLFWGIVASFASLALTIVIDSIFWRRLIWPEGVVFYFNTVLNKSHEWGIMPWHWYFTSALPRMLLFSVVYIPFGIYAEPKRLGPLYRPVIIFLCLYSFLPHKELRFIIHVAPVLNAIAAVGLSYLWRRIKKITKRKSLATLLSIVLISVILVDAVASAGFFAASSSNYPGGRALTNLHYSERTDPTRDYYVHIDVPAAQTGISRFLERSAPWRYSKQEGEIDVEQFTHLVTANRTVAGFHEVTHANGFSHISYSSAIAAVKSLAQWPPAPREAWNHLRSIYALEPKIFVHKKDHHPPTLKPF